MMPTLPCLSMCLSVHPSSPVKPAVPPLSRSHVPRYIIFSQLTVLTYIVLDDFCGVALPGCWARCASATANARTSSCPAHERQPGGPGCSPGAGRPAEGREDPGWSPYIGQELSGA